MKKLLTVCLATVAFYFSITYSINNQASVSDFVPGDFSATHKIGDVILSMTDSGVIELYNRTNFDPSTGFSMLSNRAFDYSQDNPLLSGALWIGGLAEDTSNHGEFDTLVTTAGGGRYDIHEFQPANSSAESVWRVQNIADHEIYAIYYDTLTDPEIVDSDTVDNRPHMPLGLKITQHSRTWDSPGYDKYAVIDFYIENIYNRNLRDVWLGMSLDESQKQLKNNSRHETHNNRMGFVDFKGHGIGWMSGNDMTTDNNRFYPDKFNTIMGLMLVGSSQSDLKTNFNWWLTDRVSGYSWGPQWQSNFDIWGAFPGGGKGAPEGDIAGYRLMSNGEIDYDQTFMAYDWTAKGWIANDIKKRDYDSENFISDMLISFGPFDLNAGDIETVTVALLNGFISDQGQNYLSDNTGEYSTDSISANEYREYVDFSGISGMADTILSYYDQGFENIPPGAPRNFGFESWDDSRINLSWNRCYHSLLGDYRIYRGTESGLYDRVPITPVNFTDTFFVDNAVLDNTVYYYVIKSANIYGIEGGVSPEIIINSGQPQTPEGLAIKGGNARAELDWRANSDDDLKGYIIYRYYTDTEEPKIIDTVSATAYIDAGLNNGLRYRYKIKALDIYGNLSYCSDSVSVIPMAFDSGIMLVNANIDGPANPDYDSMAVFYESMLENYQHIIVYECPPDLPQLSPYSTIIWCKEIIPGRIRFDRPEYLDLFSDYLDAGGKLIIAGTRIINNDLLEGSVKFDKGDFYDKYFNLQGIDYPSIGSTEFTGGLANRPGMPDFKIAAFKAERIVAPFENLTNRLFGIGALIPKDSSEVIYRYQAINPDTSKYNGLPVAVIHRTDIYKTAILEFPLYYIETIESRDILFQILDIFGETVDVEEQFIEIPDAIKLLQNFPNPFNFRTEIRYFLPENSQVTLEVYDILGRNIIKLVDEYQLAGQYSVIWDGRGSNGHLSTSGVYFYRLTTKAEATTKRMIFLK